MSRYLLPAVAGVMLCGTLAWAGEPTEEWVPASEPGFVQGSGGGPFSRLATWMHERSQKDSPCWDSIRHDCWFTFSGSWDWFGTIPQNRLLPPVPLAPNDYPIPR